MLMEGERIKCDHLLLLKLRQTDSFGFSLFSPFATIIIVLGALEK